jgi:plasmid maintenance system antidote protein VapI
MSRKITAKDLAEIIGISERRVNQLVKEGGIFSKELDGKFDVQKNVENFYKNKFSESDSKANYDDERAKHEKIKRERASLHLKMLKGDLHKSKDVEEAMTTMIVNAKQKLLGLPTKAAPMVIGYKDITSIQQILGQIVEEALLELVEYSADLFGDKGVFFTNANGDDDDD